MISWDANKKKNHAFYVIFVTLSCFKIYLAGNPDKIDSLKSPCKQNKRPFIHGFVSAFVFLFLEQVKAIFLDLLKQLQRNLTFRIW